MIIHRTSTLIGAAVLLVVNAALAAQHPAAASDREAVEKAMRDYAATLRSANTAAVTLSYTPDGELLLPGLPALHGHEAINKFLAPLVATTEVESVEMQTDTLEVNGKTADQWGIYRQVAGPKGQPKQTHEGRYAAVWHLEEDGHWRLFRLMMQPVR